MIRQAKILEIPDILSITKACAADMASRGIYQWNDSYPSEEIFLNDLERQELYVLEGPSCLYGCIVISSEKDLEYEGVSWLTPDHNTRYIHRLCIHPDDQGRGYARQLMDFAEALARAKGAASVRLDTFSRNLRNQKFYELRGYRRLADVYFPKQSEYPFFCYELVLKPSVLENRR